MKSVIVSISIILASGVSGVCADAIAIDRSRALGALSIELQRRYGYLVTYEEAPYDSGRELRTELRRNGDRFLYPASVPMVFQVTRGPANNSGAASVNAEAVLERIEPLGPDIVDPLVKQYNESGNPGNFSVIYEGRYAHIVPDGRIVNGRLQQFEPVLSTTVQFMPEPRSCYEVLKDLFGQIKLLRGVDVVEGIVPFGGLIPNQCTIQGGRLTARQALTQILNQVAPDVQPGIPRIRFAWGLLYDVNVNKYFLSTTAVPDRPPDQKVAPRQSAGEKSHSTATEGSARSPGSKDRVGDIKQKP